MDLIEQKKMSDNIAFVPSETAISKISISGINIQHVKDKDANTKKPAIPTVYQNTGNGKSIKPVPENTHTQKKKNKDIRGKYY